MKKVRNLIVRLWVMGILLAVCCLQSVSAQESRNAVVNLSAGEFAYVKKQTTVGSVLSTAVNALATNTVYIQDESYIPLLRATFEDAASSLGRIRLLGSGTEGEATPDIVVDCKVSEMGYTTDIPSKKNLSTGTITGHIDCLLQIKDAHTGELLESKSFKKDGYELSIEAAMKEACKSVRKEFRKYLNSRYPLRGEILEKGLTKKDKLKEAYINLGADLQVQKNMTFIVYEVKTVANREVKTELGKLKVTEVSGGDISLCKITKGGDKIGDALADEKTLLVVSE